MHFKMPSQLSLRVLLGQSLDYLISSYRRDFMRRIETIIRKLKEGTVPKQLFTNGLFSTVIQ